MLPVPALLWGQKQAALPASPNFILWLIPSVADYLSRKGETRCGVAKGPDGRCCRAQREGAGTPLQSHISKNIGDLFFSRLS